MENMLSRTQETGRKGFISAPLIGTVIFLSAVIFIVNLQNVEAQASLRVANDAYHNRVSSVLEQYRSDLASIFREGLSRTLSYYILRQGWQTFTWSNDPNGRYFTSQNGNSVQGDNPKFDGDLGGAPDGKVSLQELKYGSCESIKRITSDVVCSIPLQSQGSAEYKYGLPQWMSEFLKQFTFEGITFTTSNQEQIKVFLPNERIPPKGTVTPEKALDDYDEYCRAMLQGSIFDCKDFATQADVAGNSKMHCIDHDANNNGIPDEPNKPEDVKEIPGCEQGTFFVKVNVENPVGSTQIYDRLPRVEARDNGGNVFRSSGIGGVGEKNIYLPISLRIFQYYDDTFKMYSRLAYGQTPLDKNEGYPEGVADGHCGGPNAGACANSERFEHDAGYSYVPFLGMETDPREKVKNAVATAFYGSVLKSACSLTAGVNDRETNVCGNDCTANYETCAAINAGEDLTAVRTKLGNPNFLSSDNLEPCSGTDFCVFYGGLSGTGDGSHDSLPLSFQLVDKNDAYRIDPTQRVVFKWGVNIQHDPTTP